MRTDTGFILTLALLLVGATAESQLTQLPDVTDFQPSRDLSDYRTYAWSKSQTVPTESMANHLRIINAVQAQMKERGFRLDTVNPELRIRYRLELQERVRGSSTQERSVWDDANSSVRIDISRQTRAQFAVQIVDAESNFLLWHVDGNYGVGTPDRSEVLINEAIADLFEQFPTKD